MLNVISFSVFGAMLPPMLSAAAVVSAAAAVPILIHLLNRRRYVVVQWAAMRFLLAAHRKNVRRMQLEQWLLLVVRTAIVALLAAITPWGEPLWRWTTANGTQSNQSPSRTHHLIVIDGSFSMATRVEGRGERFALAKEQARRLVRQSPPGDGFSLIFLAAAAQSIITGPAEDRQKIIEEIDELALPQGSADIAGGLRMATDIAMRPLGKFGRREVVFITDLKRSSWQLSPLLTTGDALSGTGATIADLGKAASLVFVDVAREDVDNRCISSLTLADPLPLTGADASARAIIQNFSPRPVQGLAVSLSVGVAPKAGEKLVLHEVGQQLVNIDPNSSLTVTFPLQNQNRFRDAGDHILQAQIAEDDLRLDDWRSLSVTVRDSFSILIVDDKKSVEPLDRPGEWVRRALRPDLAGKSTTHSMMAPTVVGLDEFQDRFRVDLNKYDAVFLCDLPKITPADAERLDSLLQRGGSVVIGLGPNAVENRDAYNRVLYAEGKGILPGKLLGVKQAKGDGYFSLVADHDAYKSPPLNAYRDDRERASLTQPIFQQYVRLSKTNNNHARRIFSFSAGSKSDEPKPSEPDAAVVDCPRLRGHVIVYTSTFNPELIEGERVWSNWPRHPTFLPFLHETLRYVLASASRRNLQVGETIEEFLPLATVGLKAHLTRGAEILVETSEIVVRGQAGLASFTNSDRAGIYRISTRSQPSSLVAINLPVSAPSGGAESNLRRLTQDDLEAALGKGAVQLIDDVSQIPGQARPSSEQFVLPLPEDWEAWRSNIASLLLAMALLLMLLEVFLAWHRGSARASPVDVGRSSLPRWRLLPTLGWLIPMFAGTVLLGTWAHAMATDDFLGYFPTSCAR